MCFGDQKTGEKDTVGATTSAGSNTSNMANNSTSAVNTGSTSLGTTDSNTVNNGLSLGTTGTTNNQNTTGTTAGTSASNTTGSSTGSTVGQSATNTVGQSTGTTVGNTAQNTNNVSQAVANPAIAAAALGNLDFVNNLQAQGFQGYTGQQVANLAPQQAATIGNAQTIANNGTGDTAKSLIGQYSSAPAQSVSANTIASGMSPYMNQYVMQALAPQLQQMDISNARTDANTNAMATGSGAFGDARAGIEASSNKFNQNVQREGVIGNAYNQAFNTAIGASAQDQANNLSSQNANAGYMESALGRALGGAGALQNLQTQQLGTQTAANSLAGQVTAQQQAELTANYNQWLMKQQYPFQTAGLVNSTVGQAASALPATQINTGSVLGSNTQATANLNTGSTVGSNSSATQNQNESSTLGSTTGTNTSNTAGSTTGTSQNATQNTGSSTGTTANTNAGTSNTVNAGTVTGSGTSQNSGTSNSTATESKPDNSGLAFAGSLLSAFI